MRLAIGLGLVVAGCSVYVPQPIEISDQKQYAADWNKCQSAATAYKPSLSLGDVASATVSGGASNAAGAVINPLVPVIGAAGGATSSLASGFNLMGQARKNVARHCLEELTHRDRSAVIADPD